ncbi:hypothetical protein ACFWVM_33660 [Nocardia fluminea]|uniref:hypothetical protein n=1 Tax=Nocardia fluminea TaxID=134984 RepID=UPI00365C68DB
MEAKTCPRCGMNMVVEQGRGRPRRWCSDECRRLASEERRAARRTDRPVEIREEVRERVVERSRPLSPDAAVDRVLSSDDATEKLLRVLAYRMRHNPPITPHQQWMHSQLRNVVADLLAAHGEVDTRPRQGPGSYAYPSAPAAPVRSASTDRAAALREAVALVMTSPRAVREVLVALADQARKGMLDDAQHSSTVTAAESLFGALVGSGTLRRRR